MFRLVWAVRGHAEVFGLRLGQLGQHDADLLQVQARDFFVELLRQALQPTAMVHEAWLKISGDQKRDWNGRQHFFAAAEEAMRRILVDRARRRLAAQSGTGELYFDADDLEIPAPAPDDQLLEVSDALEKFAALAACKAELVKLRYCVGLNSKEAAEALDIAAPTAKQGWAYARA